MKPFKHFIHKLFRKNEIALHPLNYLFWECTLRCNLHCQHCGSDCKSESEVKDMPIDDFLNAIKPLGLPQKGREKTIIAITGGEPLMRKDLAECGRKLRENGFRWGIVTNALAYSAQRHRELMDAGMESITVSVDGLAETHNALRQNSHSFEKAIEALALIANENRLNYDVVTCVHQGNICQLQALKDLFIAKGIKAWRLFTIAPIGRAKDNPALQLDGAQLRIMMDFIATTRKEGLIDLKFSCESFTGVYEDSVRDAYFFCRAGINIASVLIDGSICACPNINRNFVQGNIYKDNFMDVWENKFQVMRQREWMRCGICKQCKDFKYCKGGAMHLRSDANSPILRCLWQQMRH